MNGHSLPPKTIQADLAPISKTSVVPPTPAPTVASATPVVTPVTTAVVPVAVITGPATLPVQHSTAAVLKTPKKDLSLYDEEESTYSCGNETAKHENPAHPAVVEDMVEVKKLPKEPP
ncbi:hypothetical protein BGW39_001543 [Mortierella sp. 14UC]|nr:hypothetical protein BGW39_001543 [Mortierella sp. 14UC]